MMKAQRWALTHACAHAMPAGVAAQIWRLFKVARTRLRRHMDGSHLLVKALHGDSGDAGGNRRRGEARSI